MELSKRLQTVAELVSYPSMADIGTDHGYVPIYLHKQGKIKKAFACDVRRGPLEKAEKNIVLAQGEQVIETRLGSGLLPIGVGEIQTAVIAGMGGMLMIRILSESPEVVKSLQELILSPQLDVDQVRRYVHQIGFQMNEEIMVQDEGKNYHVIRCVPGNETYSREIDYLYGKMLLEKKEPLLLLQVRKEFEKYTEIRGRLLDSNTEISRERLASVEKQLAYMKEALACLLQ